MNREQIKSAILNMCPDARIENDLFLNEEVLKDFSLEDIAYRLSGLIYGDNLYKYLYGDNSFDKFYSVRREMVKYIVINNIDYFSLDSKDLFYRKNILMEYERLYGSLDFTLDDFKKCSEDNLKNNINKNYYEFDLSYYNLFIMVQKLYKDGKIKIGDIKEFVDFNIDFLRRKFISEVANYDSKYDRYIYDIVSYFVMGNVSLISLDLCLISDNSIKNLLFVSKFGVSCDNLNNIPIEVIGAISGKKLRKIYNIVSNKFDFSNYFEREKLIMILFNMCVLLSDEVVNNIVRHLPFDEDAILRLFYCFLNIDLNDVKVIDNNIFYNRDFIKFFVGDSFMEPTSLLNLIYNDKSILGNNIEELYYCFDKLCDKFREQKLLSRTAFFEQSFFESRVLVDPDEYKLEGSIINSYYDDRKYQELTFFEAVKRLRSVYKLMRHNYQKSIPYVSGDYKDYKYEMLRANDPSLFKMGSLCDCCFKLGGDASSFVEYCALDKNARVLCVNDDDRVVAMIPMVRNGNLVLCNSIESKYKKDFNFMKDMFKILEIASNDIIKISSSKEGEDNVIGAVLIGNYINDVKKFGEYRAVSSFEIDDDCIELLEEGIYSNISAKYCGNYYISYDKRFDYKCFRRFDPDFIYDDPRSRVLELESEYITDDVKKCINSIYYELEKKVINFDDALKVIFNDDWFIFIDEKHKMISGIVGKDSRAMMEYQEYLELEREYCSYYDMDGNVLNDAKYR